MAEPQQGAGAKRPGSQSAGARLAAKRAAKAARKAAKRGTDTPVEDELMETVSQANSWLDEHQKAVWGTVAAIGLVGTLILTLTMHRGKVESEAAAQLYEGVEAALAPIVTGDEEPAEEDVTTYTSLDSRAAAALTPYRKTQRDFPDSIAAQWARLGEANALAEQGKYAEALGAYDDVAKVADGFLKYAALEGAGFAQEAQDNHDQAIARFDAAGQVDGGLYKPNADYHAARMLVAKGDKDAAIKRLQALVEAQAARVGDDAGPDFSRVKSEAEALLTRLGAAPATVGADLGSASTAEAVRKLVEGLNTGKAPTEPATGEGDQGSNQGGEEASPEP